MDDKKNLNSDEETRIVGIDFFYILIIQIVDINTRLLEIEESIEGINDAKTLEEENKFVKILYHTMNFLF